VTRAIREHLRDFIAVALLFVFGLAVTGVILSQQQAPYPEWIPFLGDERFELKAEFEPAQAVTPGQGQTVNIAGVEVGDVTDVELEGPNAVVTMAVQEEYAPLIRSDSTMLLRPRTGLQDMTVEIDTGTSGEPVEEGTTIPLSQTEPNVQVDQILASLDGDTRTYLQLLISGAAEGLGGRGKQLSAGLRRFEPLARDLARLNGELAKRRANIAGAITSFRSLADALARDDTRLAEFVTSQSEVLGAFAEQEASLRETLQELPGALRATRSALESSDRLALELGPASRALIPAAQAFAPGQRELQPFLRDTVAPIRDQIRPFTREVRQPVKHLKGASGPLGDTTNATQRSVTDLNRLFNAWAYNPRGGEEGFLFWTAWLNHNTNNIGFFQDAHGPLLRGLVLQSCSTADIAEILATDRPFIRTLQQLTNVPQSEVICPLDPTNP
jgi:phospholipid/cholesterol/gamma-HCH transport system substrate-binding protein